MEMKDMITDMDRIGLTEHGVKTQGCDVSEQLLSNKYKTTDENLKCGPYHILPSICMFMFVY